jgi:hypothetical protein
MDLAWALMVETIQETNLSNSSNVKFVKVLNIVNVAHIVPKTFKTPIVGFTYWPPPPSSISCELNKLLVLEAIIANHLKNQKVILVHVFQNIFITWKRGGIIIIWRKLEMKTWSDENKRGKKKEDFFLI